MQEFHSVVTFRNKMQNSVQTIEFLFKNLFNYSKKTSYQILSLIFSSFLGEKIKSSENCQQLEKNFSQLSLDYEEKAIVAFVSMSWKKSKALQNYCDGFEA